MDNFSDKPQITAMMNTQSLEDWLRNQRGLSSALPLAVVDISGADAQEFLQGQLTMDLNRLPENAHRLTAWCNARGRVWCVLRIWRSRTGFGLLLPNNQIEAFVRRMRMFILRAQVRLNEPAWRVHGLIADLADAPELQDSGPDGLVLKLDAHHGLLLQAAEASTPAPATQDLRHWLALRMLAGEPQIDASTQEEFLPQSLGIQNFEGLHFNKGCYVGQEIVARVHYKGRTPQRLRLLLDPAETELAERRTITALDLNSHRLVQVVEHIPKPD